MNELNCTNSKHVIIGHNKVMLLKNELDIIVSATLIEMYFQIYYFLLQKFKLISFNFHYVLHIFCVHQQITST